MMALGVSFGRCHDTSLCSGEDLQLYPENYQKSMYFQ